MKESLKAMIVSVVIGVWSQISCLPIYAMAETAEAAVEPSARSAFAVIPVAPILILVGLAIIIGLPIIPARLAREKGYSFVGFYLFGLFLFVPALIVALVINSHNDKFSVSGELLNYSQLLKNGAITQEEFDEQKKRLLGKSK